MKYIMNNKILAVFIGFSLMLGLGLATTNTVLDAWNDEPGYMQDAELELTHSDTVQEQEYRDVCQDYEETENGTIGQCLKYEEELRPGESVEVIEFRNQDFEYVGTGEARISFEARVNQSLVGSINSDKFEEDYMLNGEIPGDEEYSVFAESLQDVSFESIGGQINNQEIESSNVNAGWQNMEFVVEFEDFRHGGVSLNQDSGIRLSTGNYNGGGNL